MYHSVFTYCKAMDQVKQGSKTLLDLFQASSTKKCRPNKGLDSPTPGLSTNDPRYATYILKKRQIALFHSDKKSSDNCPLSKSIVRQKKKK